MAYGKKVLSNVFYYSLDFITITLAGYIFWILMGKMLIPEQYGILTTVVALFYVIVNISSIGLFESLSKLVPELMKKGKTKKAHGMIRYSLKLSLPLSFVSSFIVYFFSETISYTFYGSADMVLPLQILSIIILTGTAWNAMKGIFIGLQKFKELFVSELLGSIARVLVAVVLVFIGLQAIGAAASWSLSFGIIVLVLLLLLPKLKRGTFDKLNFFKYSFSSLIYLLSFYLLFQGGIIILSVFGSMASVAMLGATVIISQILLFIPLILKQSLLPSVSESWPKSKKRAETILSIAIKYAVISVAPFAIFFTIFSDWVIKLLYTDSYLAASSLFPGFFLGTFLFGISHILLLGLYSSGRPVKRTMLIFLSIIINIVLAIILVPVYNAQGAVIAFLTSQVFLLVASLFYTIKIIDLRIRKRSLYIIPVIILFSIILYSSYYTQEILLKVLAIVFGFVAYLFLIFCFRIISKNDTVILKYLPDKFGGKFMKRKINKLVDLFDRKA